MLVCQARQTALKSARTQFQAKHANTRAALAAQFFTARQQAFQAANEVDHIFRFSSFLFFFFFLFCFLFFDSLLQAFQTFFNVSMYLSSCTLFSRFCLLDFFNYTYKTLKKKTIMCCILFILNDFSFFFLSHFLVSRHCQKKFVSGGGGTAGGNK